MYNSTISACEEKMDKDKGKDKFKSKGFRDSLMSTNGLLFDPWHSTPVKNGGRPPEDSVKHPEENSMARRIASSIQSTSANQKSSQKSSPSAMQRSQIQTSDLELTIIQKQRTELQLLVAELKDREQELNSMAAAHHRQLHAWEQDRQTVLSLEQKCARLEDELQKRNKVIRAICKRLKSTEVREQDGRKELNSVQQQMQELSQRQKYNSQHHQDLEEKNRSLNSSLLSLSSQLGQIQAHEEELNSLLKIKDAVLTETTNRIARLSTELQDSESALKEYHSHECKTLQELEEYKSRLREAARQNAQIKDELKEKNLEINSQREELISLRQENQLHRKELALAVEGENWREELLALARSKQERSDSELLYLRQVYEHQQNDLQLMKLNLDASREALIQYESQSEEIVARASCAIEHGKDQETEVDESIGDSPSTTLNMCDLKKDFTIAVTTSGEFRDVKKQVQHLVSGSDEHSAELAGTAPHVSKRSHDPAENEEDDCCSSENEVDVIVVIDHITELDDQLVLVDVNSNNTSQSSRPGDVTCVYVDCSGPSPKMRTVNPGLAEDSAFSIQQEEAFTSSTSRLQRFLAESHKMVASLKHASSSENNCNSACSPDDGHNNTENCEKFQCLSNSLEENQPRMNGSQIQSINSLQKTKEYGQ